MTKQIQKFLLALGSMALAASFTHAATILTLADVNPFITEPTPGANAFRVSDRAGSQTIDGSGNLVLGINAVGANGGLVYNAIYFAPVTLGVGEYVNVNFSGTATNISAVDDSFRVGLFNSGGNKLTGDVSGSGVATLANYTGYSAYYRSSGATAATARSLYERTASNNVLWNSTVANIALDSVQQKTLGVTSANPDFSGFLRIENTNGTTFTITSSVNGQSYSTTDSTGGFATFDTLSFFMFRPTNSDAANLTISALEMSVIPEPGTLTLVILGLAGSLLALRRR